MNLNQLETFVHVAEHGSFSKAALVLGVAQPALSRQVRALEVELRESLFLRHGRGVQLTETAGGCSTIATASCTSWRRRRRIWLRTGTNRSATLRSRCRRPWHAFTRCR